MMSSPAPQAFNICIKIQKQAIKFSTVTAPGNDLMINLRDPIEMLH